MSLDVYLYIQSVKDPHRTVDIFTENITNNLGEMANEAGIYEALWRPDELGIKTAGQLVEPLKAGLEKLKADPEHFKKFNPKNKWGDYEDLIEFVTKYLDACENFPDSLVVVWR